MMWPKHAIFWVSRSKVGRRWLPASEVRLLRAATGSRGVLETLTVTKRQFCVEYSVIVASSGRSKSMAFGAGEALRRSVGHPPLHTVAATRRAQATKPPSSCCIALDSPKMRSRAQCWPSCVSEVVLSCSVSVLSIVTTVDDRRHFESVIPITDRGFPKAHACC
jgi:hypothetical protein